MMPVISVTVAHKKETWVVFLGTSLSRKYAIHFECSRMDSEKPCPDMAKEVETVRLLIIFLGVQMRESEHTG